MMSVTIETTFSPRATAFGVPRRINRDAFELRSVLESYSIGNNYIGEKKQEGYYKTVLGKDTGWLMYLCCTNDMETGRLIAANIVSEHDNRHEHRTVWQNLGNNEVVKGNHFPHLVVIDGYFDDSPSFRRDRIYDLVTYHHDRPETSILIVGKTASPTYMSKVLGLRPNFALLVTG